MGFEYIPPEPRTESDETTYEMVVGSARVEELILAEAPRVMRRGPPVLTIQGGRYWLTGIHLSGGAFRLENDAHVVFDRCLFSYDMQPGRKWFKGTAVLEVYGDRRAELWTPDKGIVRGQQEVLTALFESQRAREKRVGLAEYVANYRERAVLVLGSYLGPGRVRFEEIKLHLRDLGYDAVLLADVPDQEARTLEQKLVLFGSLARFVVMDDSERSGHLAELPICKQNGWITAILREGGRPSSAMSAHASVLSTVMLELDFDAADLRSAVQQTADWAEERRIELQKDLQRLTVAPPPMSS